MENANLDNQRLLSLLCHGACLFSATIVSVGIPIALLFTTEDSVVKANAREALNFQITVFIAGIIGFLLLFVGVGFIILPLVGLFSIIFPIIAMVKVLEQPGQPYRYPLTLRLL